MYKVILWYLVNNTSIYPLPVHCSSKCNCLKNIRSFPSVPVQWAEHQRLNELKPPRSQWILIMKNLSNGAINLQGDPRVHTNTVGINTRTYEISQRVNAPAQCSQQSWLWARKQWGSMDIRRACIDFKCSAQHRVQRIRWIVGFL